MVSTIARPARSTRTAVMWMWLRTRRTASAPAAARRPAATASLSTRSAAARSGGGVHGGAPGLERVAGAREGERGPDPARARRAARRRRGGEGRRRGDHRGRDPGEGRQGQGAGGGAAVEHPSIVDLRRRANRSDPIGRGLRRGEAAGVEASAAPVLCLGCAVARRRGGQGRCQWPYQKSLKSLAEAARSGR